MVGGILYLVREYAPSLSFQPSNRWTPVGCLEKCAFVHSLCTSDARVSTLDPVLPALVQKAKRPSGAEMDLARARRCKWATFEEKEKVSA